MPLVTDDDKRPTVSVIIPSYNSRSTLPQCLDSLYAQKCDVDYEILLVDSSEDGTPDFVTRRYPEIRLIHYVEKTLPGKGRNRGAREARGEILLFTDADCIAPPDWIHKHILRQRQWDIVGGALTNANPHSWISWASYLSEFNGFTPGDRCMPARNLVTANVSYKKQVFHDDQFREDIWPGEDRIFNYRASAKYSCCLDTSLTVAHVNRSTFREYFHHQYRLGSAAAAARKDVELAGSILLRRPVMVFLVPFYRTGALIVRTVRDSPRLVARAALTAPITFVGAVVWAKAFHQQCARQ